MNQRVSVPDVAKEIGCDQNYLRQQMRRGEWDLGSYVKPGREKKKASYFVFRNKLDKFLGIAREAGDKEKEENQSYGQD